MHYSALTVLFDKKIFLDISATYRCKAQNSFRAVVMLKTSGDLAGL